MKTKKLIASNFSEALKKVKRKYKDRGEIVWVTWKYKKVFVLLKVKYVQVLVKIKTENEKEEIDKIVMLGKLNSMACAN